MIYVRPMIGLYQRKVVCPYTRDERRSRASKCIESVRIQNVIRSDDFIKLKIVWKTDSLDTSSMYLYCANSGLRREESSVPAVVDLYVALQSAGSLLSDGSHELLRCLLLPLNARQWDLVHGILVESLPLYICMSAVCSYVLRFLFISTFYLCVYFQIFEFINYIVSQECNNVVNSSRNIL